MIRLKELYGFARSKMNAGSASELGWVLAGQVFNVGLGFVILKLLSKMGSHDYGIYALVITISSLLAIAYFGPVLQGFIRFYYKYLGMNKVNIYINSIYRLLFISFLGLAFLTILIAVISPVIYPALPIIFFIFAGIYVISQRIGEFFNGFLNLIRKRKQNSLLQGAEKLVLSGVLLLLVMQNALDLVTVLILFSIVIALFTIVKIYVFSKYVPRQDAVTENVSEVKKEIRQSIITYVVPFLLWGISGWLQLNGEKWIIANILSASDVGIYAVMMALVGAFVAVPGNILGEFSTPVIFQNYADPKDTAKIKSGYTFIKLNMVLTFIVTLIATAVTALFGREIIILISTPEYALYWDLLPLLCFGSGLFYTGQALTTVGMALNQPKRYLPPKVLTGVVSVILNLILISLAGIAGAAYSMVITGLLYLVYIIIVNKKILSSTEAEV